MAWIQENMTTIIIAFVLIFLLFKGVILGKIFGVKSMSPEELKRRLGDANSPITLIDVRTPGEFNQAHIKASHSMPLGSVGELIKSQGLDQPNRPIAVICASGSRSMLAATQLKRMGLDPVYNISGGISAWQRRGFEVQTGNGR